LLRGWRRFTPHPALSAFATPWRDEPGGGIIGIACPGGRARMADFKYISGIDKIVRLGQGGGVVGGCGCRSSRQPGCAMAQWCRWRSLTCSGNPPSPRLRRTGGVWRPGPGPDGGGHAIGHSSEDGCGICGWLEGRCPAGPGALVGRRGGQIEDEDEDEQDGKHGKNKGHQG
jgi:hypothetical protein